MITTTEIAEQIVRESPYLESAIAEGLINLSSLARKIQPQIQKKLLKTVHQGAILMALKRLEEKLKTKEKRIRPFSKNLGDLTLKSNLSEFTFRNSPSLILHQKNLLEKIKDEKGISLTFSQSLFQTSLIINSIYKSIVEKLFAKEKLVFYKNNLSAITMVLPDETVRIPGVYYFILKTLAWNGINIIETISSFNELTLVFEDKDIDRSFSLLKNLNQ